MTVVSYDPVPPGQCAFCGGELPAQAGRGRPRKFCSDRCCDEHYNEGRRRPKSERVCPECGETFLGWANRILCGKRKCKDSRYRREHPDQWREQRNRLQRRRARKRGAS